METILSISGKPGLYRRRSPVCGGGHRRDRCAENPAGSGKTSGPATAVESVQ